MNIIYMIIIGFLAGSIAKLLTPGKDKKGCVITILLGIAGSVLAGFLGQNLGFYQPGESAGFIASTIGAVIILLIFRMLSKKE